MDQILGWIATILFSIMLIPQIIKTIRKKDKSGVSLLLFITYFIANIIAYVYAYMIDEDPLMIKYLIGIFTSIIYISVYFYYTCR